jgi:hypothetical protein
MPSATDTTGDPPSNEGAASTCICGVGVPEGLELFELHAALPASRDVESSHRNRGDSIFMVGHSSFHHARMSAAAHTRTGADSTL